jgi:hypothetical protein
MKKVCMLLHFSIIFSCLNSCNKHEAQSLLPKQITAIVDITDPHAVHPEVDAILRMYRFDQNKDIEAHFRLCLITDKELNHTEDFHLNNGIETEKENKHGQNQYRERLILNFYQNIRTSLMEFNQSHNTDTSLAYSECFKILADEIQLMKSKQCKDNTMLIFSDMQENSKIFSCYSKHTQEMLENNAEKVINLFEKTHLLPDDLAGFTFFFVYEPVNRAQDQAYTRMLRIYQKLLEKRTAVVKIQTNNKSFSYE